jgi:pilus assembly protein CpaC
MGKLSRVLTAVALFILVFQAAAWAQVGAGDGRGTVSRPPTPHGGTFAVPLNRSQLLQLDRAFSEVSIGNPDIASVVPLTTQMVYVFGQDLGSTNMTFLGDDGQVLAVVDLVVSYDIEGLKERIHQLVPGENIQIRPAGRSIVLSGQVTDPARLANALAVAEQFAPQSVTNLMQVSGSQQVMLEVRFAEINRQVAKDIGVNVDAVLAGSDLGVALLTGVGVNPLAFGAAAISGQAGDFSIDGVFDALEEKGLVRVLAEPNLVVLSGDTADFLAGGEFPIPVAQGTTGGSLAITIEFKEFGVSLAFTPTVLGDDLINLVLRSEVSAIDPSTSVVTSSITVPGLSVRRTRTTIELRDGQSFAIAGLLQDDFRSSVRQFPWLGDVPVLGTLFRSTGYQRRQTELVVIVTPRLVQPVAADSLRSPTDFSRVPTERDLFLKGLPEGAPRANPARALEVQEDGGIYGPRGYILR